MLMAYVNYKGYSFYNTLQSDTEHVFHSPQPSPHDCALSSVKLGYVS